MNLRDLIFRLRTLIFKPKTPKMFLLYCDIPVFYDNKKCYFYFIDLRYNNIRRIKVPKVLTFNGLKHIKQNGYININNIYKNNFNIIKTNMTKVNISKIDNLISYLYESYPIFKNESCDCCKIVDFVSASKYFYNSGKLTQRYQNDNYTFKEVYKMIKNIELLRDVTIQNISILKEENPEFLI